MSYASRSGRARTNPTHPEAFSVCQRCGIWHNRAVLRNQMEWRGAALMPTYIFVCPECWDTPQEQLRAVVVPADPVPVLMPFVEAFYDDSNDNRMVSLSPVTDPVTGLPIPSSTIRVLEDGQQRVVQVRGRPGQLDLAAIMPLQIVDGVPTHYGVPIPFTSIISDGSDTIRVTCSAQHGLLDNDQIAVEDLVDNTASGFFSVTVINPMVFTYQTYAPGVRANSLAKEHTLMVTCRVGIQR